MLTDTTVKNAKPRAAPYKISDGYGLYLLVTPTAKLWNMAYRFNGKQKKLSFGAYPALTLSAARVKRDAAKTQLANGIDPGMAKQEAKREKAAIRPFGEWADEWLVKQHEIWGEETKTGVGKTRWVYYLKPEFGTRVISDITRGEVLEFLRTFEGEGKLTTRDRVRGAGYEICLYADVAGTDYNPFRNNFGKQLVERDVTPRPAMIRPAEVKTLFETIAAPFEGSRFRGDIVGSALRFIALTVVRPGEIADAEWTEFDSDAARWTIPADKMKTGLEHVVPLSRQALAILAEVRKLTGHRKFVFSCSRDQPISDNTLNDRLRRLGYDTTTQHCAHGFRSTFSTLSNRELDRDENKKWDGKLIELQLAHIEKDKVLAVYNRTDPLYLIEPRARLLQHWADRIDIMVGNNVVKFELAAG